jgi:hypothetical protein
MFRRAAALVVVALTLVGCSKCNNKCKEGITFSIGEIAGALAPGGQEQLNICFDNTCHDVTVTRQNAGGSVFLPFNGVGKAGDHHITVKGTGSFQGDYTGPVFSYTQDPGGSCKACSLTTVKIGIDGTITPAMPVTPASSTTVAATPTTANNG